MATAPSSPAAALISGRSRRRSAVSPISQRSSRGGWMLERGWGPASTQEMTYRIIDVRPADLSAATAALQQLALALFEELFADGERLSAERWFALREARLLDRIPFTRLGWRRLIARAAPFLKDKVIGRKQW